MVKFKVPLKDILGRAYYQYELSSSNYDPQIDTDFTLTCTCKNVLGNPIADKEVELFENNVSQGTATTNANGIATFTITPTSWGKKNYMVGNATIDLTVGGWKQVQSLSDDRVKVFCDGKNAKIRIGGTFITSTSSGEFNLGTIDSAYKSDAYYVTSATSTTNYLPVYLRSDETTIHLYKGSTSSANISCYCTLFYPLKTPLY